jgi:hypothetical protein
MPAREAFGSSPRQAERLSVLQTPKRVAAIRDKQPTVLRDGRRKLTGFFSRVGDVASTAFSL